MNYFRDYDYKIQKAMRNTDAFFNDKDVKWEEHNQNEVKFNNDLNYFYGQAQPKNVNITPQKYDVKE